MIFRRGPWGENGGLTFETPKTREGFAMFYGEGEHGEFTSRANMLLHPSDHPTVFSKNIDPSRSFALLRFGPIHPVFR